MASSVFLRINKSWSENVYVRLRIKWMCWDNGGDRCDLRTVCFIILGNQQQKICRAKLLSAKVYTHFYPEHLSFSGKGGSDKLFKIMDASCISESLVIFGGTLQADAFPGFQDLIFAGWGYTGQVGDGSLSIRCWFAFSLLHRTEIIPSALPVPWSDPSPAWRLF